jgi:hypothetical protein
VDVPTELPRIKARHLVASARWRSDSVSASFLEIVPQNRFNQSDKREMRDHYDA